MEFDFTSNIPSQKMASKGEAKLTRLLNSYGYLPVWSSVNPVNLNISLHILHIVPYTFIKELTRRIWLTISSFFSW